MAANVSGNEKHNTIWVSQELRCSPYLTTGIHDQLKFISVLNSFLSITAFLGNSMILVALRKESSLHPPSKLLLRNLATTDFCVGLFAEPIYVALLVTAVNEHWNICHLLATATIGSKILIAMSLLTMTAISVDRLLALLLGLRYSQVVTLKRVYLVTITFCIVSAAFSAMAQFLNSLIVLWCNILFITSCLAISIFCYSKIFFTLCHHQHQVQDHVQQPNQTNQLNIAR